MNNPELYSKCNNMIKVAAVKCLDDYTGNMDWKHNDDTVIDLGCGDGSVTHIIKQYIPSNYKKFVACDINENMIKFASSQDTDDRTTYRLFDIEGDLPFDLRGNFDHAFSFFTLHWMKDQEKAFRNIFNILSEGGDCLLSFLGYTPIYHLFNVLGSTSKWSSSWLKHLDQFISPYYDMEDIEDKIKKMLTTIGFTGIEVKNNKVSYLLDNGLELKNLIKAVEPYHMPTEVFEDLIQDCLEVGQDIGLLESSASCLENYNKKIDYTYNLIVIYAKKPHRT